MQHGKEVKEREGYNVKIEKNVEETMSEVLETRDEYDGAHEDGDESQRVF